MSAPAGHPSLRRRIAEALTAHLAQRSQREIADDLGVAGTTVGRRGDDLTSWPALDLLALALVDADLRQAIGDYLGGDAGPQGDARRAPATLLADIAHGAELISAEAAALKGPLTGPTAGAALSLAKARILSLRQLTADLQEVTRCA